MKKIVNIKSIALIATSVILASCSSDFLDLKPESNIVSGSFSSAEDAENLLVGAYSGLATRGYFQYNRLYTTEGVNDNHYVNGDNPQEWLLETFNWDASTVPIQDAYKDLWGIIAAANTVTDNVSLINSPKWAGTDRKDQILAEARFLRGLCYYELVTQFGGVPILTSLLNGGNLYPARNTEAEVYQQIITDLTYAEGILPAVPYKNEKGRATKGAAQALLAKTYAQMLDYKNCLIYANKVIDGGNYSLVPNFANMWHAANKNSQEAIFEIQSGGNVTFWGFEIHTFGNDKFSKRNIITADLINAFNAAGDNGPRYQTTVNFQQMDANFNMPANAWDPSAPIPYVGKYEGSWYASLDNIKVLRLGDIILLAAEANAQLVKSGTGGSLDVAKGLLNQIRNRAGLINTTATTQAELALAILKERRLELVFESNRWNDLKRADANGIVNVVDIINNQRDSKNRPLGYTMDTDKHQFTYPIPQQERNLNSNLTQNPGYN